MRIGVACTAGPPPAELLDLLEAAGLPAAPLRAATPPAHVSAAGHTWTLASATDVLRGCDRGGLDLGIVGRDRLLEGRRGAAELLDLRCCRDDLVYAAVAAGPPGRRLRVASRYPETARRYFAAAGRPPEIVVMDDPVLAPALGLADGVVELASRLAAYAPDSSGAPLPEPGDLVAACTARLVSGRAARVLLREEIGALVTDLRAALERG